ncbi:TlpA family protein disulfide reductase [Taibaiella sp. KBW10]|uniref:TlpA family protein disulfide reductase n=1 Tax=Taibaiella sp. KBW10 TaxID=2153357 RepID=UPI000F59519D|nr:TlpA disulfide reductase family protein [Taibaiella sp. KBW10]RQO29773.1 TlpA family protein disulfide reductase [Taibaiella sp. KBW10]
MKRFVFPLLLSGAFPMFIASCNDTDNAKAADAAKNGAEEAASVVDPVVTVVKYEQLMARLQQKNDTLYVVNFWATWCGPCVRELPHFVTINDKYKNGPFKFIMVSLDEGANLKEGVIPFLKKKNIQAEHYLLDDNGRMNEWIPKFDKSWTGAIPVTILYKQGEKKAFHEGSMDEAALDNLIKPHLQ